MCLFSVYLGKNKGVAYDEQLFFFNIYLLNGKYDVSLRLKMQATT